MRIEINLIFKVRNPELPNVMANPGHRQDQRKQPKAIVLNQGRPFGAIGTLRPVVYKSSQMSQNIRMPSASRRSPQESVAFVSSIEPHRFARET
jgi:hypothetical protein